MAIIKRRGAQRTRGLDQAGIDEALRRYSSGESLATIGRGLGVDHGTVRYRLIERGVQK